MLDVVLIVRFVGACLGLVVLGLIGHWLGLLVLDIALALVV